ncbi:MAG TPA: DUF3857 domain-containing transglutaminase family protein [Blastocatellia bacterium]|nr:DUF3857 domain-containing transglutaminase family protein [Blastocatellia bacterium]
MKVSRTPAPLLISLFIAFVAAVPALAGDDWKPIDPAHLAMKAPVVEKDADAEAIFWEVRISVEDAGSEYRTTFFHYVRIKVFTERGKEKQSTIELPYLDKWRISDVVGRTIKPDGSIVELKKDQVFDRTAIKFGGRKVKVKSFAMPGVEPGAIIEYRWREARPTSYYTELQFQREVPVQSVKYYIKTLSIPNLGLKAMPFHCQPSPLYKEKDGYQSTGMVNVPAFREEPRMPPEDEVRMWMLLYYSKAEKYEPEKFWREYGKKQYDEYKSAMKVNDDVRKAAAEAVGDATTPEQKLERILFYCRTKIKNIQSDASGLTEADIKKMKENRSPSDTLKRGYGDLKNIDMLFAAMAAASGLEARPVRLGDRGSSFFDRSFPDEYFMRYSVIAVKVGSDWKFFDPSSTYTPYGMLRWGQEGIPALVTDSKEPAFVDTPLSPPERSVEKTIGKFKLSEDGTLEGDAQIELTGHLGERAKDDNDDDSPQKREETLRNIIKKRMSTAEVSNIRIENVTDPIKPFIYAFHVKVPGYATRTGKRLFVQPAFFQFGEGPLFPTTERKHAVYFEYAWLEDSVVNIEMPEGFALDNAEAPESFNANDIVKCEVKLGIGTDKKSLVYTRRLKVNGMLFPVTSYPTLKQVFDFLHKQDNHAVTLKLTAAASSN